MIDRPFFKNRIADLLQSFRAVELVGPRQIGKTTLTRESVAVGSLRYFDLEDPVSRARLSRSNRR